MKAAPQNIASTDLRPDRMTPQEFFDKWGHAPDTDTMPGWPMTEKERDALSVKLREGLGDGGMPWFGVAL